MRYIVTIISIDQKNDAFWSECKDLLSQFGEILTHKILSHARAIDYYLELTSEQHEREMKEKCRAYEKPNDFDIVIQRAGDDERMHRQKRLVVFDMDSTLIQQEVIDMIAAYGGIEPQVAQITESAMRGEIDFSESLKQRVSLLKDIPSTVFESLKPKISFTPGARELCKVLKQKGYVLAVLSGGFIPLAKYVQAELGLDYAYANNLDEQDGKLTGTTYGRIINATAKAELLQEIARSEHIVIPDTIAIGDGSNDLEMMAVAGYGVAFNAKPIVQQKAPGKINTPSLRNILYILGYSDEEINGSTGS